MISSTEHLDSMNVLDRAMWIEKNCEPPTIHDFIEVQKRPRLLYLSDGTRHRIKIGVRRSGVPVYHKDSEDHPDDWRWTYPIIGEAFVAEGRADALEKEVDYLTYYQEKNRRKEVGG